MNRPPTEDIDAYLGRCIEGESLPDFDSVVSDITDEFGVEQETASAHIYRSGAVDHEWDGDDHYVVPESSEGGLNGEHHRAPGDSTDAAYERLTVLEDVAHPLVPDPDGAYFQRRLAGHKTDVQCVSYSMSADTPKGISYPLLIGMPGVGKNRMLRDIAANTNRPLIRIPCDESIRYEDVVGHYAPTEDGGFEWSDGLLTTAMRIGALVVLDEVNMMEGDVSAAIHQATESDPQLVIRETGEVVDPHDEYRVAATMNPTGFAGTVEMNKAFEDRFDPFEIPHLPTDAEKQVVLQNVPEMEDYEDELDDLLTFANACRERYPQMLTTPVTTRKVMTMCDYLADGFLDLEAAIEKVILPLVDEEEKNAALDALDTL